MTLTTEVFDSDGTLAVQLDGQDVAHFVFVDRKTAADANAEAGWRELTDDERTALLVLVVHALTLEGMGPAAVVKARAIVEGMS